MASAAPTPAIPTMGILTPTPATRATPTTRAGDGVGWREWVGRLATAASACWRRVVGWFRTPPTPADLRAAERRRRKQIKRQLRQCA